MSAQGTTSGGDVYIRRIEMDNSTGGGNRPQMEDYGSPADQGNAGTGSGAGSGQYSGGTEGTQQGSSQGEQFGDFDHTGTGVDLTVEMENTDVRSGLVKGGEAGADDAGGPGRYGGDAGSMETGSDSGASGQGGGETM